MKQLTIEPEQYEIQIKNSFVDGYKQGIEEATSYLENPHASSSSKYKGYVWLENFLEKVHKLHNLNDKINKIK